MREKSKREGKEYVSQTRRNKMATVELKNDGAAFSQDLITPKDGRRRKREERSQENLRTSSWIPKSVRRVSLLSSLRRSRLNRHRFNVLETCFRTFTRWSNEEEQPTREGRTFEHSPFKLSPVVLWRLRSVQPPTTQSVRKLFLSGLREETEREKGREKEIEGAAGRLWSW